MQRSRGCLEAKTMHESTSFAGRTRSHMHMSTAWKQPLASHAVESMRTMVLRCTDCPEMFNTLKEKFEHQVDRECPCGIYFGCRSQFSRHVRIHKCQPLWIRRLPAVKCYRCSQTFKTPSELIAHRQECGRHFKLHPIGQSEEPTVLCTIKRTKKGTQRKCTRCDKKSPCYCILERIEEGCEKDESVQQKPKELSTSCTRGATENSRCTFC
jgi:hypothetical protein